MRNSLSMCYSAVKGPRKPLSSSNLRERQIPTNAKSSDDFLILELYESNLAFLIQALKDHRNSKTSYSFTNAIEHAPHALRCHPEDIYRAYDIQDTPYIYERQGTFSFWFLSQDKKLDILRDLRKEAMQLSQVLHGKPRSFRTKLNDFISTEQYDDQGMRLTKALNLRHLTVSG